MGQGYMGKVLFVDLGSGRVSSERIPSKIYQNFLSGLGLGAYLLYDRIPAGADPLGPENVLGFLSGLLTGTGSLLTGRWMVVGKSPLTGGWGDANCGGNLSPAIKRCGYDGIFISGVSSRPVYLYVDQNKVQIRDATHLWGMDAVETEQTLRREGAGSPKRPVVACIGPAGEKCSLISGVVNDRGRLAARSGLGAVMGSKKLKALVLAGALRISPHDRRQMYALSRTCNEAIQSTPPFVSGSMIGYMGALARMMPTQLEMDGRLYKIMLDKWGTVSTNQMSIEMGDAPIKNWKGSNEDFGLEQSASISPDKLRETVVAKYHCYSCPLGCGAICRREGPFEESHRPEYETVLALGGLLLNSDVDSIFYLNEVLNRAGMDSISAGATVAFALECYEQGLLTREDTGGLELTWGNADAIVALVEKMIRREGIGDLLADGTRAAAARIGANAGQYAMQAGGQELGMHDGRFDPGFALHYSAEPTPGRHTIGSQLYYEMFRLWDKVQGLPDPSLLYFKGSKYEVDAQKAVAAAACSKYVNVLNGAGGCLFGAFLGPERFPLFDWLNAATGWRKSPRDYLRIGERIQTLKQAFNIRHGIEPKRFKAADRALGRPPLKQGANADRTVPIEDLMRAYWEQLGWDPQTGKPRPAAMRLLDL